MHNIDASWSADFILSSSGFNKMIRSKAIVNGWRKHEQKYVYLYFFQFSLKYHFNGQRKHYYHFNVNKIKLPQSADISGNKMAGGWKNTRIALSRQLSKKHSAAVEEKSSLNIDVILIFFFCTLSFWSYASHFSITMLLQYNLRFSHNKSSRDNG